MIKLLGKVPRNITVALSGGIDSMCLLDFLSKKHKVDCAFFHHGTQTSELAYRFLTKVCEQKEIVLHTDFLKVEKPAKLSAEEWWRNCRYEFLSQFETVATAHHLDDVVETWVWSSLHGTSSLMPYKRGNVIRPFLLTKKSELAEWSQRNNVQWIDDESNLDIGYTRNYIRHVMMPHILKVNPGIHTLLKKKLVQRGVE
jgi:tRNA(Ile)-lysidine synthase